MLKRMISKVLIMTMLFTSVLPVMGIKNLTASADSPHEVHLQLNFDNYPTTASTSGPSGQVGGGWSLFETSSGTDYAIGQLAADNVGQYFTMVSNTTGKNINIQKSNLTMPVNTEAKTFLMSGKFKFSTTTHERRLFQTTVNNAPTTSTVGTYILFADTLGKFKMQYPTSNGNQTIVLGDYVANQWYEIELAFDLVNRTLHISIDGQELEQTIDLGSTWNNFSSTRFVQIGKTGEEGQFSLDDIIYQSSTLTYEKILEERNPAPEPSPPTIHPDFDSSSSLLFV